MANPYSVDIDQITLENFQSLRERVEIPIRPLTFLFGPNSAGKSSIYDSLAFVNAVFKGSDDTVKSYINRWSHVSKESVNAEDREFSKMTIEVRFKSWEFFIGGPDGFLGELASLPEEFWGKSGLKNLLSDCDTTIDIKLEVTPYEGQHLTGIISLMDSLAITIYAGGLKLMRLYTEEDSDEPEVEFFPQAFGSTFKDLAERHNVDFSHPRILKASCWAYNHGRGLELDDDSNNDRYDRDLVKIANHLIRCLSQTDFLLSNVSADRQTIPNSELSIFFHDEWSKSGLPKNFLYAPIEAAQSLSRSISSSIYQMARSRFEDIYQEATGQQTRFNDDEMLHTFVNRSLSHHLFLDQGYQVVFDVCELKPPLGKDVKKGTFAALLVAHLIDSAGRRMTFEDVGTGISCVLPVIVAMYEKQSFIQQPELHLHPALQSALGDILVESVNREGTGQHLIETHSDYLLLRCLRRIRETSNHKISENSTLKLKPTDLSILYFDPQADGSTRIKPIRVSSQGDFLDRWPRGFFEERGKDLFDE